MKSPIDPQARYNTGSDTASFPKLPCHGDHNPEQKRPPWE